MRHFNLAVSVLILSHPRHMADTLLNDLAFSSIFLRKVEILTFTVRLSVYNREVTLYF